MTVLARGVDIPHAHTNQTVDFDNCYNVQKKKRETAVLIIQIFIFYLKFYPLKNTCAPVAFSILYKEDNVICTEVIYRKCI